MKRHRLPRILLNATTALSLLLCATIAAMWIRSHRALDYLTTQLGPRSFVLSNGGELAIHLHKTPYGFGSDWHHFVDYSRPHPPAGDTIQPDPAAHTWRALGMTLSVHRPASTNRTRLSVVLPYRIPFCLTAALPLARTLTRPRRRPKPSGLCPHCGYDLRATPTRCPECGATPHPTTTA